MEKIKQFFESIFNNLGLVMGPLAAAGITGLSVGFYFYNGTGHVWVGATIGLIFAFGLEALGYRAFLAHQLKSVPVLPISYLVLAGVAVIVTELELEQLAEYKRAMIGLVAVAMAGGIYWAESVINSDANSLTQKIESKQMLEAAGMTMDKNGNISLKRSNSTPSLTPKALQVDSKSNSNKLRWNNLSPEVKQNISELSYSQFCGKHGAVSESTFYHWQSRIDKEAV